MKNSEKILFIYSIVAITAVFISSAIFNPSPQNLVSSVILLPLLGFFWLRITNPGKTSLPKWSLRVLITIVVISSLGVYATFLSKLPYGQVEQEETQESEAVKKMEELKAEIESLKEVQSSQEVADELASIKAELTRISLGGSSNLGTAEDDDLANILMVTETPSVTVGYVTIRSSLIKTVDVYEEDNFDSEKIDKIRYGTNYPFFESVGNWYMIKLEDDSFGWVHERDVKETDFKE